MTWLLYLFGAYLAGCYLWAIYLAVRLYTGKRVRVVLFGARGRAPAETSPQVEAETLAPTKPAAAPHRRAAA